MRWRAIDSVEANAHLYLTGGWSNPEGPSLSEYEAASQLSSDPVPLLGVTDKLGRSVQSRLCS